MNVTALHDKPSDMYVSIYLSVCLYTTSQKVLNKICIYFFACIYFEILYFSI